MPKARPKKKPTPPVEGQTAQPPSPLGEEAKGPEAPGKSAAGSGPPEKRTRVKKSGYVNGLRYDEKTGTYHAHGRAAGTFTCDTKQKDYDKAQIWVATLKRTRKLHHETGEIPGLTVKEGLEIWTREAPESDDVRRRPSARRIGDVNGVYRRWILHIIGGIEIIKLTEADLKKVIDGFKNAPGPHGPHHERGVRNFKTDLNTPLRWLRKKKKIRHLVDLPSVPQPPKGDIVVVPPELLLDLVEHYDKYVRYDLYSMLYLRILAFTGLRTEDTRELRKEQFSYDCTSFNSGITKNKRQYKLPVPEDIRTLLRRVPNFNEPGLLFPSPTDAEKRRQHGWCLGAFRRAAKRVGLRDRVAWHRLRASYATTLIRSGADILVLLRSLGWETLQIALHYVRTTIEDLSDAQDRAMDFLKEKQKAHKEKAQQAR